MRLIFAVLLLLVPVANGNAFQTGQSQPTHRIALSFSGDNFIPNEQQRRLLDDLDIRLFEISDPSIAASLSDSRYRFLVDASEPFTVPGLLSEQPGAASDRVAAILNNIRSQTGDRIAAVSTFQYPFETYNGFAQAASVFADSLTDGQPFYPLYYKSAFPEFPLLPEGFNFTSKRISPSQPLESVYPVMHLVPAENSYDTYQMLNSLFEKLQALDESIVILPARWFFQQLGERPDLQYLFSDYTKGDAISLPLPEQPEEAPFMNWSVMLLLLIWGSFALHFRFQPIYSQSMARYFTNHSFFVNDVMENRLRNVLPGFILLIQHALLTGLFLFACVEVLVSSLGLGIIRHYFSALMVLERTTLSLFIAAVLIAVVLQTVSVIWIYLINKKLTSFSQILNLYSWPLHLNLIVVTFLVVFNTVGFDEVWTLILGSTFILIWFFSFNIAAIDSSKFLENGRIWFLLGTVGIHVCLVIGILIYVFFTPSIIEPILFAVEVP